MDEMQIRPNPVDQPLLVMGIGNILVGDEGVGVHAVNYMQQQEMPEGVELLDGGTGGFHLLSLLLDYPRMILIDATLDGNPPGTLKVVKPKFAGDFPRTLSSHDIGLKDLVESAAILGDLPEIHLITISITDGQKVQMELSENISRQLPEIYSKVLQILKGMGIG